MSAKDDLEEALRLSKLEGFVQESWLCKVLVANVKTLQEENKYLKEKVNEFERREWHGK